MALDPDDKIAAIGCLSTLALIGVVAGVLLVISDGDLDSLIRETDKKPPLTKVAPTTEKTTSPKAPKMEALGRKVSMDKPTSDQGRETGVAAAVENLGEVTALPSVSPIDESRLKRALAAEPLCYRGKMARRAPSLYGPGGFAITYGTDTAEQGDPRPRLEIFFNGLKGAHPFASVMSLSETTVSGFPNDREQVIPYSSAAIEEAIAKWIVAVADGPCPRSP